MTAERVRAAFRRQAADCRELGSPLTALVCELCAERLDAASPAGAAVLGWPGDPQEDALALRLAGALHALALMGRSAGLAAVYPPSPRPSPDRLWRAIAPVLAAEETFIREWLSSPPQTNEVARSGILLGGFLTVAAETGLPLVLSEIGASAGLNLHWDRYGYRIGGRTWGAADAPVRLAPEWRGRLPDLAAPVRVAARAGCDRNPLDPGREAHRLRLLAYVWPDQAERIARIRAALALAAQTDVRVAAADAADWLERRLAAAPDRAAHVVYHTIVRQYLAPGTRDRIGGAIEAVGARADAARPLAWLRFEPDGASPGAALALTLWPGGEARLLARGDFHGRWVDWRG